MGMSFASGSAEESDSDAERSASCSGWCWWACFVGLLRIEDRELGRAGSWESRAVRAWSWMAEKERLRGFGETEAGGCVGEG
jgi:hypothetical protein